MENPFPVSNYVSPEYFCNRESEANLLINNIENGIHTTLFSIRRLGKTGLIKHVLQKMSKEKNTDCIYFDILSTQSQTEFTTLLSNEIIKKFPPQKTVGKKFIDAIRSFRPMLTYDVLTGTPELSLDIASDKVKERSLMEIFQFLDSRNKPTVVAIDEFQQILHYKEKNTEALLRSIMQEMRNIRFVYCGSHQQMMNEIFNSAKRPFFASCQNMYLDKIAIEDYKPFIIRHFEAQKKDITDECVDFILEWTCVHTYYTQYVCNRVFASGMKKIKLQDVQQMCFDILKENEAVYFQYRNLLTDVQWQFLKALAKETELIQPYSADFIFKYKLGAAASVKRSLDALLDKEMVYYHQSATEPFYAVYDKFLMRWLQRG